MPIQKNSEKIINNYDNSSAALNKNLSGSQRLNEYLTAEERREKAENHRDTLNKIYIKLNYGK